MKGYSYGIGISLLFLFFVKVSDAFSQHVASNRKSINPNSCDYKAQTSLVEHFFNVIFAEFHKTPPVCVCVQMCPDQSTYCYPTGCMKTGNVRKPLDYKPEINDNTKLGLSTFDSVKERNSKKNHAFDFIGKSIGKSKELEEKSEDLIKYDIYTPSPFKDRYKIVFKYRRLPKVGMRYDLRDKVQNMKFENTKIENKDMSSQRWPKGKHWIHSRQLVDSNVPIKVEETKSKKLYMFTENDPSKYTTTKYFKREATKMESNEETDVETLYIYERENVIDDANLSALESMIDNLIDSSFEGLTNLVSLEANNTLNQSVEEKTSSESYLYRAKNAIEKISSSHSNSTQYNETLYDLEHETRNNETHPKNKYMENTKNIFSGNKKLVDLIDEMCNKIEQKNNKSIDVMNKITDRRVERQNIDKKRNAENEIHEIRKDNTLKNNKIVRKFSKLKRDIAIIDIPFYPMLKESESQQLKTNRTN